MLIAVVIACLVAAAGCLLYAWTLLRADLRHRSQADATARMKGGALPRSADRIAALTIVLLLLVVAGAAAAVHEKVN